MIGLGCLPARTWARLLSSLAAVQVLACLGTSLVLLVLPEEPYAGPGYYEGDGDDAGVTSERFTHFLDHALTDRWMPVVSAFAPLRRVGTPVGLPDPDEHRPSLPRSPPA